MTAEGWREGWWMEGVSCWSQHSLHPQQQKINPTGLGTGVFFCQKHLLHPNWQKHLPKTSSLLARAHVIASPRVAVKRQQIEKRPSCQLWPIVVQQIHVSFLRLPPLLLISLCVQGNSSLVLLALFSLSLSFQMLVWLAARWRRGRSDPLTFALTRHAALPPSFCQRPFKDLTGRWWSWWVGVGGWSKTLNRCRSQRVPSRLNWKPTKQTAKKTKKKQHCVIACQLV